MDAITTPLQFIHANMKRLFLLTGLDPTNDRFHADISNLFIQNNDQFSKYEILATQYEKFETSDKVELKPNVGILRISWIDKYTQRRPAVVLLFVDVEWDDPNFNEKKTECESKIHSLKQTIKCQEVRYLLVLIQRKESSVHQNERAAELCTACGLVRTQLFPLYVSDGVKSHVIGAIKRSVADFSQQFYQAIHKKIRTRRVPENHINLMIRNQFKLGYISELRNDLASAMSFYKLAFDKYSEAKIPDEDKYEYLTVASIINYKICEIYFSRGNAIDAVTQFNRHEDKFMKKNKFKAGKYPSEILADIEHAKWCMREYATFGHIFVEAANAVVLNTSVNPGKYFHSAGEFSEIANNLIEKLKDHWGPEHHQVTPEVLNPTSPLIFLGQRPWRPNVFLANPSIEHRARVALERHTLLNYEQSSIHFKRAIVHFRKIEKCSRQMRVAELRLANVLLKEKNFDGALNVTERVFRMMRETNGLRFYVPIYFLLYELYFAICDPVKLLQIILQILDNDVINSSTCLAIFGSSVEATSYFLTCFNNICSQQPPDLLPIFLRMLDEQERNQLLQKWQHALNQPIKVDLTQLRTLFFAQGYIHIDSEVCSDEGEAQCEVRIQNNFLDSIGFTGAEFMFDIFSPSVTPQNPAEFFIHTVDNFLVPPNEFLAFNFPLKSIPAEFHGGCEVTFSFIELKIGNFVTFVFDNRHHNFNRFSNLIHQTTRESIRIIHSEYPLELTQENIGTVLKGDIRLFQFSIKNNGKFTFSDIKLKTKGIVGENRSPVVQFYENDQSEAQYNLEIMLQNRLLPNESCQISFCASFENIGEHGFEIEFCAILPLKESSTFKKCFSLNFDVQEPFEAKINVLNVEGNSVDYLFEGHQAQIEAHLKAVTDCVIIGYEFFVEIENFNNKKEIINHQVCADESHVLNTIISSKAFSALSLLNLGTLCVFWKRNEASNSVSTIYQLGTINFIKSPISITAEMGDGNHIIHKAIHVQISIINLLKNPLTLKLIVHRSDVFMFAGTNEIPISLEPGQIQFRTFSFVANVAGELLFPKISIECNSELDSVINSYAIKALPKTLLVMPMSKALEQSSC